MKKYFIGLAVAFVVMPLIAIAQSDSQPSITVTSPNGGEAWKVGSTYPITWTSQDIDLVNIDLKCSNDPSLDSEVSQSVHLANQFPNTGSYAWAIPETMKIYNYCEIAVTGWNNTMTSGPVSDWSNSSFRIIDATPPIVSEQVKCVFKGPTTEQRCNTAYSSDSPLSFSCSGIGICVADVKGPKGTSLTWKSSCGGYAYTTLDGSNDYANFFCGDVAQPSITILSPNGGETWTQGADQTITWTTNNIPTSNSMTVRLRDDAGKEHYFYNGDLAVIIPNYGFFTVNVPPTFAQGKYKAEVKTAVNGQSYTDASDNYFSIVSLTTTCTPNWRCDWGACTNGWQSQTAVDSNNCGGATGQIACTALARQCAPPTQCKSDADCPQIACFVGPCPTNNCVSGACVLSATTTTQSSINIMSGPTSLKIGETGTWQTGVNYPVTNLGTSRFFAVWGDEQTPPAIPKYADPNNTSGADNAAKFFHAYKTAGIYHPMFTVINQYNQSAQVSTNVNVGNVGQPTSTAPLAGYEDIVLTNIQAYQNPFPDTDMNQLSGKAAAELSRRAVIGGFPDGKFKGGNKVNRAEAAKFLLLARFGIVADIANNGRFPDVLDNQWYTKFVVTAANNGVINGYPDGSFRPADTVNTAEFLKMLSLTFGLQLNTSYSYSDVSASDWFAPYAGIAQKYNLFPSRTASLYPEGQLSREDVAVAIYQYLSNR